MSQVTALRYLPMMDDICGPFTVAASAQGKKFAHFCLKGMSTLTQIGWEAPAKNLEQQLADALRQSQLAVQQRARYLGKDQAHRLNARLAALFDPEEWSEGDPIPTFQSAAAVIKALCVIPGPVTSIGISRVGNLTAIWRDGLNALTVEGLSTGKLTWARAWETQDEIFHETHVDSTLADLLAATGRA